MSDMRERLAAAESGDQSPVPSRRSALKVGAVAGAAMWAAPVISSVGLSSAHADEASGGGENPPPPPTPKTCIPSNGLLFFTIGGTTYGVKVGSNGEVGKIPTGKKNPPFTPPSPSSWSNYSGSVSGGTFGSGTDYAGLYLVVPAGATFYSAYVVDGNPTNEQGGGDTGHDYVSVTPDATGRLVFTKACG